MDLLKDLAVPVGLLVVGIVGKWLVSAEWDDDFALMGPDLILAGIGAALAHVIDYVATVSTAGGNSVDVATSGKLAGRTIAYLVCAAVTYLVCLKLHQFLKPTIMPKRWSRLLLGAGLGNLIGLTTVVALLFLLHHR